MPEPGSTPTASVAFALSALMLSSRSARGLELGPYDLSVNVGEVACLVDEERTAERLFDVALGLERAARGHAEILGQRLDALDLDPRLAICGQVGRAFDPPRWLSNLDLDENVLLPRSHLGRRGLDTLATEALATARSLGVDALPRARPGGVDRWIESRLSIVRAFLGEPRLVLLELPRSGVDTAASALRKLVEDAKARGAAVVIAGTGAALSGLGLCGALEYRVGNHGIADLA